jgi:hypothetical protein
MSSYQSNPAQYLKVGEISISIVNYRKTTLTVESWWDSNLFLFQVNKEDSFKPIVDYIDAQYESYLQEELKIKRNLSRFELNITKRAFTSKLNLLCFTRFKKKS